MKNTSFALVVTAVAALSAGANTASAQAPAAYAAPQAGTAMSAADYVRSTANDLNYRIQAGRLAVRTAQRDAVRAFARADLAAAEEERRALFAALNNEDRRIARPSDRLSSDHAASITLLRRAPRGSFDDLYLTQFADVAAVSWNLQKHYSTYGADLALRQIASVAAPAIENASRTARGLTPNALAN